MPALVRGAFAAFVLLVPSVGSADGPQRAWRVATPQEIDQYAAPKHAPVPRAIATPPAHRAYIDPVTNELVSSPVVPPEPEDDPLARATQAPMQFERNAKGFLKLDTSEYQMRSTARIDADGNVELDCLDPDQGHGHGHAPEPQR